MVDVSDEAYLSVAREISSDTSPVGIDAKKTHVMILLQLRRIEERLDELEKVIKENRAGPA